MGYNERSSIVVALVATIFPCCSQTHYILIPIASPHRARDISKYT